LERLKNENTPRLEKVNGHMDSDLNTKIEKEIPSEYCSILLIFFAT